MPSRLLLKNMRDLHPWTLDPAQAIRIQAALRERLTLEWDGRAVTTLGGMDVGLEENTARAAIVVLSYPDLTPLEGVTADVPLVFPYVPGLLAFREGPAILAAWEKLQMIDLPTCIEFVLRCCGKYRLPEPTRWAHKVAGGESLPVQASQARLF